MSDYARIEQAIIYLVAHAASQPSLEAVAAHVGLSPFHFQRLFCQWAGISPKRFLQILTLEQGKALLQQSRPVLEVAHELGLSGSSRLHDHFVQLEALTPGEFKRQGAGVAVSYGVHDTPFGNMLIAQTSRGICRASFTDFAPLEQELATLQTAWPLATLQRDDTATQPVIDALFTPQQAGSSKKPLSLHVSGTNFQVAVWRALLHIPFGRINSYADIANLIGQPTATRAVANAIGANPVALIIPCHRVIRQSGALGGYRWGVPKKQIIQTWEQLRQGERVAL